MVKKEKQPTMKDVALEAGVALGTVSKVFNGIPVGEAYRLKVEEAARKLGYQVNVYARGLRSNKTRTIALILPSVTHPFFGAMADYCCDALHKQGYRMLLSTTSYDPNTEQECVDMVQQNKVDGIIAITYNPDLVVDESLPFVIIDRKFDSKVPCVSSDNFEGGHLAASKLHEFGCKNMLFLGAASRVPGEADKRSIGFKTYCFENNIPHEIFYSYDEEGQNPLWDYIREHTKDGKFAFDGIFCNTDMLACLVIEHLNTLGLKVPEDVQIIGYDGMKRHGSDEYYCSTIEQPISKMAETAVNLVLDENRANAPALVCLPVCYRYGRTTKE